MRELDNLAKHVLHRMLHLHRIFASVYDCGF